MNVPGRVFEGTDPLGRRFFCGRDAWRHICFEHSDMATLAPLIKSVVEQPDEIYQDADRPERECYYRFHVTVHDVGCALKVVVSFGALSRVTGGAIVTVYAKYDVSPGRVKKGERKLWP